MKLDEAARDFLLQGLVSKLEANKNACEKAVDELLLIKPQLAKVGEAHNAIAELRVEVAALRRERVTAPLVAVTLSGVALVVSLIALGGMFWMYGKHSFAVSAPAPSRGEVHAQR